MASKFTLIKGFDSIEETLDKIGYLFPNVGVESFEIYKVRDMYYAVTMRGLGIQIVMSKDFVRCRMPGHKGLFETNKLEPQKWEWPGIYGGRTFWNNCVRYDAEEVFGKEEKVYSGAKTKGPYRTYWANNARVLLSCLFSDKTRNNDNATY